MSNMKKLRTFLVVLGLLPGVSAASATMRREAVEPPVISAVYVTGVEFLEDGAFYDLNFNIEYSG